MAESWMVLFHFAPLECPPSLITFEVDLLTKDIWLLSLNHVTVTVPVFQLRVQNFKKYNRNKKFVLRSF
jgi:hypothetical protein